MAEVISNDEVRMEAAIKILSTAAGEIAMCLAELNVQIRKLVPRMSGEAADAYLRSQSQWGHEMAEMLEILQNLTAVAADQTGQFVEHEAMRAARW